VNIAFGKRKGIERRNISLQEWILWGLLVVMVGYMIYCIFAHLIPYRLNPDSVADTTYKQIAWKQKTLFPSGIYGSNESLTNRPILLYWLFYGISGDFILSYQLECASMLLLLLLALFWLLKEMELSPVSCMFAMCLFVEWVAWDTMTHVVYPDDANANQMLTILITLALRTHIRRTVKESTDVHSWGIRIRVICMSLIAAIIGYTTLKLAIMLYIPMLIMDVFTITSNFLKKKPNGYIDRFMVIDSFLLLVINVLFYGLLVHFHSNSFHPLSFRIASVYDWMNWDVISTQLSCLLVVCGFGTGGSPTSPEGIRFVIRGLFSLVALITTINVIKKDRQSVPMFYSISAIIMLAVEILSASTDVTLPRYYLVITFAIPIACAIALNKITQVNNIRTNRALVAASTFCVVALFSCVVYAEQKICVPTNGLIPVAEYIQDNGYHYVTSRFGDDYYIKGLTNGEVEAQHYYSPEDLSGSDWLANTNRFCQEFQGEPNILLLTDDEEHSIIERQNSATRLLADYAQKVAEFSEYNLYALTENPFTLVKKIEASEAGLPPEGENRAEDYPTDLGYQFRDATLNDQNELVSNGTEGCILWGPYTDSVPGVYDITLHYVVESCGENENGIFDVALDAESVMSVEFSADEQTALLDDISIEGGHNFEARVTVPSGMVIRIQYIEYERVAGR